MALHSVVVEEQGDAYVGPLPNAIKTLITHPNSL